MHLSSRIAPFCLALAASLVIADHAAGQNATSLSPGAKKPVESMITPATSAEKKHRKGFFAPRRASGFKKANVKHTARYEFYDRLEQVAKDRKRMIKKLAKPQYSDPRYFGHKKIPKRRPPHKMRYCGECNIRH
jgi:hypothetical protein